MFSLALSPAIEPVVTKHALTTLHMPLNPPTRAKNYTWYSVMIVADNPPSLSTPPKMTSSVCQQYPCYSASHTPIMIRPPELRSRFSPSSRLFPTASHAERTSTLRPGYEALGGDLVLGSRAVACWNNATEDFGLQMSDMPSRFVTTIYDPNIDAKTTNASFSSTPLHLDPFFGGQTTWNLELGYLFCIG